jgi:DNA invertase Pin-like site-specific DNA recombinase
MDSKVDFRAVDNPHATKPMVQMLAVFAEHERDLISQRTKEGLAAAKRKGVVLGRNAIEVLAPRNAATAVQFAKEMQPIIRGLQTAGFTTIRSLCKELNRQQIPSFRAGKEWCKCSVHNILKRLNTPLD